jgi:hypothetical protein
MTVGHGCGSASEVEGIRGHQSHRRDSHDTAAALGIVERLVSGSDLASEERAQARGSWRTLRVKKVLLQQPARGVLHELWVPGDISSISDLGVEPAQVGAMQDGIDIGQSPVGEPVLSADEAFCGEEGHLRVVSDTPETTISRRVLTDTTRPESPFDLGPGEELDRCAERVTDGATE